MIRKIIVGGRPLRESSFISSVDPDNESRTLMRLKLDFFLDGCRTYDGSGHRGPWVLDFTQKASGSGLF